MNGKMQKNVCFSDTVIIPWYDGIGFFKCSSEMHGFFRNRSYLWCELYNMY